MENYDQAILAHYKSVAETCASSDSCTMDDSTTRDLETSFIIGAVSSEMNSKKRTSALRLADFGCGNGYSLAKLAENFPDIHYEGFEFSPELRSLANKKKDLPCSVKHCDIRDRSTLPSHIDIVLCQRVLINLLDSDDQRKALLNIVNSLSPGGIFISIEAFQSNLDYLNKCRSELNLDTIPVAHHNKYLHDNFFQIDALSPLSDENEVNLLSTHYFITRVLHDVALRATQAPFCRNSLFVKFFDMALPLGVGEFSPLKCNVFRKNS